MRFTPAAVSLAVVLALTSSVSIGQKPDPIHPQSLMWLQQGQAALGAGAYDKAVDAFETALVIDPRNRNAYLGMAQVSRARQLPGKAIRFYDEALRLNPQDVATLQAQGQAMIAKGAIASARGNLAKITALCKSGCEAATQLGSAINSAGNSAGARMTANAATPGKQTQPVVE